MKDVYVWDPNGFNAYGLELARVVALGLRESRVTHYGRIPGLVADRVKTRHVLPRAANGGRSIRHAISYLGGLARFFVGVLVRRPIVIVAWMNTTAEKLVLAVLCVLGVRIMVVVHNPVATRDSTDWATQLVRRLATKLIVHDARYRDYFEREPAAVVPHPAYFAWADTMARACGGGVSFEAFTNHSNGRTKATASFVFIGSLRHDKGVGELAGLAKAIGVRGGQFEIAVGMISTEFEQYVEEAKSYGAVVRSEGQRYLPDEDLYAAMLDADVLVAPYTDVTVSGSIILALTLGLPVAAYAEVSFRTLSEYGFLSVDSTPSSLVERAYVLAESEDSANSARTLACELDHRSQAAWSGLLAWETRLR